MGKARLQRQPGLVFCLATALGFALVVLLAWHSTWHRPITTWADALAASGGNVTFTQNQALQKVCPGGSLITNEPDQALWKLRRSFLPAAAFARLRRDLLQTRPLLQTNHFADGYNAVNVNFDATGWEQLGLAGSIDEEYAPLEALLLFAKPLRLPRANAWSLNVVFSQPRGVRRAGHSGPQDPHIDNLRISGPAGRACTVASYQTSVLYLSVPQDMDGGNLTIWEQQGLGGTLGEPKDFIHPMDNLLVSFRGDAPHRVDEFHSEAMRVSLTLEQYIIPDLLAWGVPSFEFRRLQY
ncbi:hypothetical protein COCOBI_02-9040 [Coccomyxa sp. Obi]|nr:hypothetical protein COCOBI_02-9040 [Coccomyxa sp. Obi]